MLDHRVYRVAFLPALAALLVAAFSLADRPKPRTTSVAPLAFDPQRTLGGATQPARDSLRELASTFPSRRPGSRGDEALARRVERVFVQSGFAPRVRVRRASAEADTVDGRRELTAVTAVRQGLSQRTIVLMAHRDALRGPALAELSGTAALLEFARVFAGRDLRRTLVLASVSGGTGGFAGARAAAAAAPGPVDAVIVLGDMASRDARRPFVVPWSLGAPPAPLGLERTVQSALSTELGSDAGGARAPARFVRRALPLSLSEQGPVGRAGVPAVLVSASSERPPATDVPVSAEQLGRFGRGVLRAVDATLEADGERPAFAGPDGIPTMRRLFPDWAVHMLALAFILPALIAAGDAFFRVRRRGLPMLRWLLWVGTWAVPVLAAWGWARMVDLTGLVPIPDAPTPAGAIPLQWPLVTVQVVTLLVFFLALWWAFAQTRRGGALRTIGAGGAAAAAGLVMAVTVTVVALSAPYAALVLVPAAHLWLLVTAPETRLRGRSAWLVAAAGLAGPLVVAVAYMRFWSVGPLEAAPLVWRMIAGGSLGVGSMVVLALLFACAMTVATVLIRRGRAQRSMPPERLRTRGPATYAGPGSLGGTESALR